jgi:hypothetical protein
MGMGLGDRRGTDSIDHRSGPAVAGFVIGQKLMDATLIWIYVYIGLFGVVIGCIAYGIHREAQSHDPER